MENINYVIYDEGGALVGGYCQPVHPDHEANHIVVTAEQREGWTGLVANEARDGVEPAPPAAPPTIDLNALRQRLAEKVDTTIAAIYSKWFRFEAEYVAREAAARAFAAGGYSGDPGIWVTGFSVPAGLPANQAADVIISQADSLRAALEDLGALRMRKYEIMATATPGAAQAAHDSIVSEAAAIAANL